jgi:hypothetical protein
MQRKKRWTGLKLTLLFFPVFFYVVSSLHAMDITLQWAPNNEPDLAGYKVFYREEGQPYNYNAPYWESTEPESTIYDLDIAKTYYFVVRAFDGDGNTSDKSNEVGLKEGEVFNSVSDVAGDGGGVGGGVGGGGGGGCFIATAAYGSLLEPHVRILCQFRDRYLLTNGPGETFVKYYYKYSPPLANFISRHAGLRASVCVFLLPLVGIGWMFLNIGPGFALLLILLIGIDLLYFEKWLKKAVP